MPRENAAAKGRRYLTEGRVRIVRCVRTDDRFDNVPIPIAASVTGETARYRVTWHHHNGWSCGCEARGECAHIIATKLVAPPDERKP